MKKGVVFTVHSIAGLVSGLFILLMSLSGAILVFHDEIDSLQYPEIKTGSNKQDVSVDSCYSNVQKKYPHAQISHCHLPEKINQPVRFFIYDSSGRQAAEALQVFVHPKSGAILGVKNKDNFISWIGALHNSLHLGKRGEWLLGFFALLFLVSIVTGIIQFRENVLAVLLFKKRVFNSGNFHQVIGVYALLFNLMIGITGFWMQRYVFRKSFYTAGTYKPAHQASLPLSFSFDKAFKGIEPEFPLFHGYVIYFPKSKKGTTAIYGSQSFNSFIHSKKFADAIFLDSTGKIAFTSFVNDIKASDRYDIINAQIHYGQYGGLPVKIIYFLLGLTGSILSITGFLQWYKRR